MLNTNEIFYICNLHLYIIHWRARALNLIFKRLFVGRITSPSHCCQAISWVASLATVPCSQPCVPSEQWTPPPLPPILRGIMICCSVLFGSQMNINCHWAICLKITCFLLTASLTVHFRKSWVTSWFAASHC